MVLVVTSFFTGNPFTVSWVLSKRDQRSGPSGSVEVTVKTVCTTEWSGREPVGVEWSAPDEKPSDNLQESDFGLCLNRTSTRDHTGEPLRNPPRPPSRQLKWQFCNSRKTNTLSLSCSFDLASENCSFSCILRSKPPPRPPRP